MWHFKRQPSVCWDCETALESTDLYLKGVWPKLSGGGELKFYSFAEATVIQG